MFKVSGYKISSMDIVNLPLIDYVSRKGKAIILSTGMAKLGEIGKILPRNLSKNGNNNIAVLHCVSSYPCPIEYINLKKIAHGLKHLMLLVGFQIILKK